MQKVREADFDKVHDTQYIFRQLVDSMARPGKINNIQRAASKIECPPTFTKTLAGIAFTTIDPEVSFAVLAPEQEEIEKYLYWNTMCKPADLKGADYIFVQQPLPQENVEQIMSSVKNGTLMNPHQSATIFISVEDLRNEKGMKYVLKGPGIKETCISYMSGVNEAWLIEREKTNEEYPLGVDMVFVSANGDILCLPRTTKVERG